MKQLICACFFLALFVPVDAQQLKGSIVDRTGEPVPNSTIYIYELSRGIAADDSGLFQTALPPGSYTCEFRSLGYENVKRTIAMEDNDLSLRIEMSEKSYLLDEVVVYPGKEDPAYRIMRKAIAYAPFHLYKVRKYTAEAYIKGSLTIDKIPALLRRSMRVNDSKIDINSLIGTPLLLESKNEIEFISPATYHQKVLALKTSIPRELDINQGLNIMTSSIYNAELDGIISPLVPGAFRFYAFKLEDVDYLPEYVVNKIRVIPRKKSPDLFSGYLYILEDSWEVYIADLSITGFGTSLRYRINYHPVKPSVFLPTTYDVTIRLNTLGVKGAGRYYASVTYNAVEVDESGKPEKTATQRGEVANTAQQLSHRQQKALEGMEQLTQKEELTTKEAYKISKLMAAANEPEAAKTQRESLEIKDIGKVKMVVDTLALKRDSAYWAGVRVLPLHDEEMASYRRIDSLGTNDSVTGPADKMEIMMSVANNPKTVAGKILQGGKWEINDKMWLRYEGLSRIMKEYNYVDGFWFGQSLTYRYETEANRSFSLSPSAYYTASSKKMRWHVDATLNYAPMSLGKLSVSAGYLARDINSRSGESRLMNSFTSLLLGQSFIRFYDSRFLHIENSIDLANGLNLRTGFGIDERAPLDNSVTYNLLKKKVKENTPSTGSGYRPHTAAGFTALLSYTPFHRYRVREGKKWYVTSRYPTFTLAFQKGFGLADNGKAPSYDRLGLSLAQAIRLSPFENLSYSFSGGLFLSGKRLYSNDLKYFNNSRMLFSGKDLENSFNLLSPYTASQEWWAEGHLGFRSDFLLLKQLPFLQHLAFDEALHLHGLSTESMPIYLEGGYSLGLLGLGRIGVFTGFNKNQFDRVGVRISLPLLNLLERVPN